MADKKICPQCGAAITEERCPFCGIVFFDFACIDMNEPFFIKIKQDNMIRRYHVKMSEVVFRETPEPMSFYADNLVVYSTHDVERTIKLELSVVPTEKGTLGWHIDTDIATGEVGEEWEQ